MPFTFPALFLSAAMLALSSVAAASAADPPPSPVRFNQLGFEPGGTKRAVVPHPATTPLAWRLIDAAGRERTRGVTRVFGRDAASGEHVHQIDFGVFRVPGDGYRLIVGGARSRPFAVREGLYGRLKYDALNFFYQNRAAVPIEARFAGGARWARPAGHPQEVAGCVAGRDAHGNEWPGCPHRLDVTGGWYDAGDHGKYVVNGGISLWTLLNLNERLARAGRASPFADGRARLPEAGNGVDDLLDEARWQTEFMLRMQTPDGTRLRVPVGAERSAPGLRFSEIDAGGMAHHKVADEKWTALPMPPHLDPERRVLFPPTTAATLNLAAVAAQCGRTWRAVDPAFADRCRRAAERAYAAAKRNPTVYAIADFPGSGGYGDDELSDEFYWAAAELYLLTGDRRYERDLRASPHFGADRAAEFAWPAVATLGTISLLTAPSALSAADLARLRAGVVATADARLADRDRVGYMVPYAPRGGGYPWGSNSSVLNGAMLLALAHDLTGNRRYRDAVTDAIDYVLGRNPLDRSYISGHGARPMRNPHHRFWANQLDPKLPLPPPGVLSGGPNSTSMGDPVAAELKGKCAPQTCWVDDARSYTMNEVAINWNAPLVWVATWLDGTG